MKIIKNQLLKYSDNDVVVTSLVKLPLTLREEIKKIANNENITVNDVLLRAIQKEVDTKKI